MRASYPPSPPVGTADPSPETRRGATPARVGRMCLALALTTLACEDAGAPLAPLEVGPSEVDFGVVPVGATAARLVRLQNRTDTPITLELPSLSPGSPFALELDAAVVRPRDQAELTVSYTPTAPGEAQANLRISSSVGGPAGLALTGRAVAADRPITVTPQDIDLGTVPLDTAVRARIELSNPNGFDLDVTFPSEDELPSCDPLAPGVFCLRAVDGPRPEDDVLPLGAGATYGVEVQFTPRTDGVVERGRFVFEACAAPGCPVEVTAEGLGVRQGLRCTPPADPGPVNVGSCAPMNVVCENVTVEPVTIVGWQLDARDHFSVEPSAPAVLREAERRVVDVDFCPITLGDHRATLTVETDAPAPDRFVTVDLRGRGGGPDIEVRPARLDFGLVSLRAPVRRTVQVVNVGFDDLVISDVLTDATAGFTAPGAGATLLPPGGVYEITIEFLPPAVGPTQSGLRILSTDPDTPETVVELLGEGIDLPDCDFTVTPATLDFGQVRVLMPRLRAFEVRNVGAADCLVTSARLEPGSAPDFSLPEGEPPGRRVAPGAALTLPVEYRPEAVGTHTGAVEFSVSSSARPFNRVPLIGRAGPQELLIDPSWLDFGPQATTCAGRTRAVRIFNPTTSAARITRIALAAPGNPAFSLALPGAPVLIRPGESATIDVTFAASSATEYVAAIEIEGTLGAQPVSYVVTAIGEGAAAPLVEERFTQLGNPEVDVLFVVDFTGGMAGEQARLSSELQYLLHFGQFHALDFQIGLTTSDTGVEAGRLVHPDRRRGDAFSGLFVNRIITPATQPDPLTVLGQNAEARPLSGGDAAQEAGLYAAYQALSPPVVSGHNAGFLRPEADLALIFVSDESEQSGTDIGAPSNEVDFYLAFLRALKGRRRVTASAIVGDAPQGCSGPTGNAMAAPRYIELAARTGGEFLSVCAPDWLPGLDDIAAASFGFRTSFPLSSPAVATSLEVILDGVSVPATDGTGTLNWTYDSARNQVDFSPFAVPEPGAQVVFRYVPDCR